MILSKIAIQTFVRQTLTSCAVKKTFGKLEANGISR